MGVFGFSKQDGMQFDIKHNYKQTEELWKRIKALERHLDIHYSPGETTVAEYRKGPEPKQSLLGNVFEAQLGATCGASFPPKVERRGRPKGAKNKRKRLSENFIQRKGKLIKRKK